MTDTDSESWAAARLGELDAQGLRRRATPQPAVGGRYTDSAGTTWLNLASNDYLALASAEPVRAAAAEAAQRDGAGATASRLVSGTLAAHRALETELAALAGTADARVFGSGYLANLGVLDGLCDRQTPVFCDRLNHASLLDGVRLSGARLQRYRHNDMGHLAQLLARAPTGHRPVIVSDSVFSMDGDLAPLAELAELAESYEAFWVVDEAHALGVLGPQGAGACAAAGVQPTAITGGFGKALGGYGGFALGGEALCAYLDNTARPFIYSTGLPPMSVAAARAAVGEIRAAGGELGERLLARAGDFRDRLAAEGLDVPPASSPILPIQVGGNRAALAAAQHLRESAVICPAIRPPTVPRGTARLRASVTLAHPPAALAEAARAIAEAVRAGQAEAGE